MSNIEPTPFGDKYVLVEHIATGGMAEIYRAQYSGIEGFAKELVVKRLRMEGFIVMDFADQDKEAEEKLLGWAKAGKIKTVEDIIDGLENAP